MKIREAVERQAIAVEDDVERDSNDSFPASDPPSWIPISRVGEPSHDRRGREIRTSAG